MLEVTTAGNELRVTNTFENKILRGCKNLRATHTGEVMREEGRMRNP